MRIGTLIKRLDIWAARRVRSLAARFWSSTDGGATVELAVMIPVIALLGVGSFDFGRLALEKMAANSAARAGAQFGTLDFATAGNINGIVQAARDDAGDANNELDVTARMFCFCPGQGELVCTATCADDSFSMMYVEVTVADDYDLLMDYPGIASPYPIQSTVRMRVR